MEMSLVATLFPGIASLFVQDPVIACARIFMIIFGFIVYAVQLNLFNRFLYVIGLSEGE